MTTYNLSQEKLNVSIKTRSNSFDWRGQFTPELIEYLLTQFAKPNYIIADPFSGSGTVLLEAVKCGYDAYGFEINPSAYFMSKFYEYCKLDKRERADLYGNVCAILGEAINNISDDKLVFKSDVEDYRGAYGDLIDFAKYCNSITSKHLLPFVINVLFLSEKDKKMGLRESLIKNINYIKDLLYSLPTSNNNIEAFLADARNIGEKINNSVDLIITSPPYINVFNYHQNYRGIVECFDFNLLQVANSEIGSNRKNRQNRFRTVIQYAIDMGHVLHSCTQALKENGQMIWVVGRCSNVRKVPFYNSAIIADLVNSIEGLELEHSCLRQFGNRFGEKIVEDVLVVKKTGTCKEYPDCRVFEQIGINHLKNALPQVASIDKPDIEVLINRLNKVFESPILQQL